MKVEGLGVRTPALSAASHPARKTLVSLSLRLKDLLGPLTRVKKKQKKKIQDPQGQARERASMAHIEQSRPESVKARFWP